MKQTIAALGFLAGLAGCVAAAAEAEKAVDYRCDDGSVFTLIFEKAGTALVMIDGGAFRLSDRRPASGIWYADGAQEFRGKGDEATWKMTGRPLTRCRTIG